MTQPTLHLAPTSPKSPPVLVAIILGKAEVDSSILSDGTTSTRYPVRDCGQMPAKTAFDVAPQMRAEAPHGQQEPRPPPLRDLLSRCGGVSEGWVVRPGPDVRQNRTTEMSCWRPHATRAERIFTSWLDWPTSARRSTRARTKGRPWPHPTSWGSEKPSGPKPPVAPLTLAACLLGCTPAFHAAPARKQ